MSTDCFWRSRSADALGFPPLRGDGEMHTVRGATLRRLSLFGYRLTRPGAPAIDFTFVDPETPARVRRVQHRDARIEFHYGPRDHLVELLGIRPGCTSPPRRMLRIVCCR